VWNWVLAYRPYQPEVYINPSLVKEKGAASAAADEPARGGAAQCPCGRRHQGSFNGFPEPRRPDKAAAASLVATSGAGVLRLAPSVAKGKGKDDEAERPNRVACATRGRPSALLRMHPTPFVGGKRYFEARIRKLDPTAVGSASWRARRGSNPCPTPAQPLSNPAPLAPAPS
jgi:hypothetical protein